MPRNGVNARAPNTPLETVRLPNVVAPMPRRVRVGPAQLEVLSEAGVVDFVVDAWTMGRGGSIVTVNIDILRRMVADQELARLVGGASLVVADGMPLVWAARLAGRPLPERVTGAALVLALSAAAATSTRSLYLIGGDTGIPEAAGAALSQRFPGVRIAGTESPPFGFEHDEERVAGILARVSTARPGLVLVGLGCPKQENLIARMRPLLPQAWFLGCGAGIPMAAGQFRRAPTVMQRMGAEWVHRLALEPRRLARRYLVDDLPFALALLGGAAVERVGRRPGAGT
jgi:N-acetylglucosaminyldiphosphoundecaprenol N-acetyl-beta-D-mannosaminyltransferase